MICDRSYFSLTTGIANEICIGPNGDFQFTPSPAEARNAILSLTHTSPGGRVAQLSGGTPEERWPTGAKSESRERETTARLKWVVERVVGVAVAECRSDFASRGFLDHGWSARKRPNLAVAYRVPQSNRTELCCRKAQAEAKCRGVPLIVDLLIIG